MNRLLVACVAALLTVSIAAWDTRAEEIGFIEDFSLASDRTVPLKQLIPGTEDYYYYHCLHYLNTEQYDKVVETLQPWIARHQYTPRVREILNRQALLTYPQDPPAALKYLRDQLGLLFNHQQDSRERATQHPVVLDPDLISRERLVQRAFQRHRNLDGFEDRALDWLVDRELDADRRRNLLERLGRPDHAALVRLVLEDLQYKNSRGFGSLPIHQQLLRKQLEECVEQQPDLLNQQAYVQTMIGKLHPRDGMDWRNDTSARQAYLQRLESFVERLAPVHNSLKAHVLYHRLEFDREQGVYDAGRFLEYLKLPRNASYVNPQLLQTPDAQRFRADTNADFRSVTLLPPVGNDEPLIESYLHHFFVEAADYSAYEPYIRDTYLKRHFAETKIVNGLGDAERWYSLLSPAEYQQLKDRIDLDFDPANRTQFAPDDVVSLDLFVKNVKTLIVKAYEINTLNYYRQNGREVDTDINLDGLVPNYEFTFDYDAPALRRIRRHFEFPELRERGVYVVDFIGNGRSSRVLVRKGRLHFRVRTSTAGQVLNVYNDADELQKSATVWMGGTEYKADQQGNIALPFSNNPQQQPLVLRSGEFSSLAFLNHEAENYELTAGIYVNRESLLRLETARLLVRPSLKLNGTPVTLSVLKKVKLILNSTDQDGVVTTATVEGFPLEEDRESTHEFLVPDRLSTLTVTLEAEVEVLSQNQPLTLRDSQQFTINQIDQTEKIEDVHLGLHAEGYFLDVLGKSGERRAHRPVQLTIKHRDFREAVDVTLQSNENGRVQLGALEEIERVSAATPTSQTRSWTLPSDTHTQQATCHGRVGATIVVPYMSGRELSRETVSLIELRGGVFVSDRYENVELRNGLLHISGLGAGDYDLLLKDSQAQMRLKVEPGEMIDDYVVGPHRQLETESPPLQISSLTFDEEHVTIQLQNATKLSRVHVFGVRFLHDRTPYAYLARVRNDEPYSLTVPEVLSLYLTGRNIGDEYRYIIDRRYAPRFPGNMLDRPELLLNPWAIRKTETGTQEAQAGGGFGGADRAADSAMERAKSETGSVAAEGGFANFDFLNEPAVVLLNLAPDENGAVRVDRGLLGTGQHVHVVAVDPQSTVYRHVALPESPVDFRDLRLANGLDPQQHFAQQKRITVVASGEEFVLPDLSTSRFEVYDSLSRVLALYASLSDDSKWPEFAFLATWPQLTDEEKREKYSKYACHELHVFLYHKDRKFYDSVVHPYLRHKKDKTFVDRWLLEGDIQAYAQPWEHARLNAFERVLLGQRLPAQRDATARHLQDILDVQPPDIDRFNMLFDTALKSSSLDASDRFGAVSALAAETKQAAEKLSEQMPMAMPPAGPAGRGGMPGRPAAADVARAPAPAPESAAAEAADKLKRARRMLEMNAQAAQRKGFAEDEALRQQVRQLYRKLDQTQEWVENNYYELPRDRQTAELIAVNRFWKELAQHAPESPFRSTALAQPSRNLHEMLLALAVLDLPFRSGEHDTEIADGRLTLKAGSPLIVYHEEIRQVEVQDDQAPILVSQNFFRHGDRHQVVNGERVDKYVTDEFLTHVVYGCQVVITNPTSTRRKLDVLLQIPVGALPVLNSRRTRSVHMNLEPYNTQTFDYYFYFPAQGQYAHFPVHVSQNEQLLAFAEPAPLKVVNELSTIDRDSWEYVSQYASADEVLKFLRERNLQEVALQRIAFRMKDKAFFEQVLEVLRSRYLYDHTLWSYSVFHNEAGSIQEFLEHADGFVSQCGMLLESPLLTIRPVHRGLYEHMEYRPLVNARTHQLGAQREILNDRFHAQYHRLMKLLSYRRVLNDEDRMAVTYYLLLQDRIEEALAQFAQVNRENLETQLQYDYCAAYLAFYTEELQTARDVVARYEEYPVDRWRRRFVAVKQQLDEIERNQNVAVVDPEDRTQQQTQLAASESSFDFTVESRQVRIDYQNLDKVRVNYYLMDIELLFSRSPFAQHHSDQFSQIRPNQTQEVELPDDASTHTFNLPEALHNSNVLVEIVGDGRTKSQAYYANSLRVQVIENYGQVHVTKQQTGRPLPKVYVKVYARLKDGSVEFYKDGYTDLRGRFDYTSLSTNTLDFVQQFSLLILSDQDGAVVREAAPPQR